MSMSELLKKTVLVGIGAAAEVADRSKDLTDSLAKKGQDTINKGRAMNEELKRKMRISGAFESQKRFKAYRYKDINFDSSYELAFYIYLEDHHKNFLYQPDLPLKYIGSDSKEHNYFPDFLVNGNFYEIKGGQFFNEAGEPYNPYSKSYWWEKYNAMVEAGVHILREKDIKDYLTYVKDTYGENYLKSFKIKRGS